MAVLHHNIENGTTSACAENTTGDTSDRSNNRNYLRVRGEYDCTAIPVSEATELPPRARRIRTVFTIVHGHL